jgi:hypothetical protein
MSSGLRIVSGILLTAAAVAMYMGRQREKKFRDDLAPLREHLADKTTQKKMQWMMEYQNHQFNLRQAMQIEGYNDKKVEDSLPARLDRIYFDTVGIEYDKERLEWYLNSKR